MWRKHHIAPLLLWYAVILALVWAFRHDLADNSIVVLAAVLLAFGFYMGLGGVAKDRDD
jgi:hypothetical protein